MILVYIYFKMCRSTKRFVSFLRLIYFFRSNVHVCFQLVPFVREHIWHNTLLMGYSMKVEFTSVCSLDGFSVSYGFI